MTELKKALTEFLDGKIQQEQAWATVETWGAAIGCHIRIGAFEEVKKFLEKLETDAEEDRRRAIKEYLAENPVEITEEERTAIRKQWEE